MPAKKITLKEQNINLKKELDNLKNLSKAIPFAVDSTNIIKESPSRLYRYETDLSHWRNALNNTEQVSNPTYAELVRLMNEVKDDAIICNAVDIRKSYVMSRDWSFTNEDGEENERVTEFFNDKWFNDYLSWTHDSKLYGYSLIKLGDIEDDKLLKVELIDRQNVHPKLKRILETPYDISSGKDFTDPKFSPWYILSSDSETNHYQGLFAKVAPYQVMHKNALLAQSDYTQRFGSPNIIVKTDINNESQLKKIERYLANFNNTSYSIANLTDDISLLEGSGKSGEVYSTIEDRMENLIYKAILGSPLSNEQNFVGSADIRQNLTNLYSLQDIKYVEHYVNNELIPRLITLGLKFIKGFKFKFDTTNKIDPTTQFNQVIQLLQTGQFTFSADWIKETFGLDVIALAPQAPVFGEEKTDGEDVQSV